MSVTCQIGSLSVFLRALYTVAVRSDGWATVVFTDVNMLVYVESTDGNMTAACTLSRSLFFDYAVQEVHFGIHIPTLIDALLMLGPTCMAASTKITLACSYETAALRVKVRPAEEGQAGDDMGRGREKTTYAAAAHVGGAQGRDFDADLVIRNAPQHLLDLRFSEAAVVAQVALQGDTVRELIADLAAAQCTEVTVRIDAKRGLLLRGQGGPYGAIDACVQADSEVLFSLSAGQTAGAASAAATRVHTHHLALACGVRVGAGAGGGGGSSGSGSSGGGSSGGVGGGGLAAAAAVAGRLHGAGGGSGGRDGRLSNADYILMGMAASSSSAGAGGGGGAAAVGALFGGFERLTLRINAQRQLNVLHSQRDHDQTVSASMVVMPLSTLYDLT